MIKAGITGIMTPKPIQSIKMVTKINPRAGVRDVVKAYVSMQKT
jgi:hypothetical protein